MEEEGPHLAMLISMCFTEATAGWGFMTKACPGFLSISEKRHGYLTLKEGALDISVRKAARPAAVSHFVPHGGTAEGVSKGTGGTRPLPLQACDGGAKLYTILVPQKLNMSEAQRKFFRGKAKLCVVKGFVRENSFKYVYEYVCVCIYVIYVYACMCVYSTYVYVYDICMYMYVCMFIYLQTLHRPLLFWSRFAPCACGGAEWEQEVPLIVTMQVPCITIAESA